MFDKLTNDIDKILDLPDDHFVFGEMTAYLCGVPSWKRIAFYIYTFTYIRQRERGREYRTCLKWANFPRRLKRRIFVKRLQSWFYSGNW
jgi:hypothetical protein